MARPRTALVSGSRPARVAIAKLTLLGVSVLICVAALEALTRLALAPLPEQPWSSAWWRERWLRHPAPSNGEQTWYPIDRFDPVLGYTMLESVDGIRYEDSGGAYVTSSNAIGARGTREYPVEPPPGTMRAVFIGDSFTFGQGVSDHETFPAALEAMSPDLEAINLAVHGYGHDQMLLRLERDGVRLDPDVVVLGFINLDVPRNQLEFRDYLKPRFDVRDGRLVLTNPSLLPPHRLRRQLGLRSLCYPRMVLDRLLRGRRDAHSLVVTRMILDEIVRVSEAAGARPVFVYLPTFSECRQGLATPHSAYQETCRAHDGLECVDPTPAIHAFLRGQERPERLFVDHYEPAVHRVIAGELHEALVPDPSADADRGE